MERVFSFIILIWMSFCRCELLPSWETDFVHDSSSESVTIINENTCYSENGIMLWCKSSSSVNLEHRIISEQVVPPPGRVNRIISGESYNGSLPSREFSGLEDLYRDCNGENWQWKRNSTLYGIPWNFTTGNTANNPCSDRWQGVLCSCIEYAADPDVLYSFYYDDANNADSTASCYIEGLWLPAMNMSGQLPDSLGDFSRLRHVHITDNPDLTGTLPSTIARLSNLRTMSFARNQRLGGDLSSISFANISQLQFLSLGNNSFTALPARLNASRDALRILFAPRNKLTALPVELGECTALQVLALSDNLIVSSIPASYQALTNMRFLALSDNQIQGTIPTWISSYSNLSVLLVARNELAGSVPSAIGNLTRLRILDISTNSLRGALPHSLKGLKDIIRVFVQGNKFSGRFPDVFTANSTPALELLDVSDNHFTGPLPWRLFTVKALNVFSAVKNCFSTVLSDKMCDARNLTTIGMDGLSAASDCQRRLFKQSKTYLIRYSVSGDIPPCLFALPQLQSLHLSGNQIESSLPSDLVVGSQLQELVLSYNMLRGNIPRSIQARPWKKLDLSFNRFKGQLISDFPAVEDGDSLYLRLNRLSGAIPTSLLDAKRIAILQGNLFRCDYYKDSNGLPANDEKSTSYNCSNSFVQLFYLWLFPGGIVLVVIIVLVMAYTVDAPVARYLRKVGPRLLWWVKAYREASVVYQHHHPSLQKFDRYCTYLRLAFVASSNYCLLILLPLYLILNAVYGSYASKYTWSLSACFLSGTQPGILLLAFTTAFALLVLYFFHYHCRRYARECVVSVKKRSQRNWRHGAVLFLISLVNFLTIVFLHMAYVFIANRRGAAIVLLVQFCLGAFKLFWHDIALLWMIRYAKQKFSKQSPLELLEDEYFMENGDIAFQSYIVLFNNVVAPYLVTIALEQSCFSSVFRRAWSIIVSYTYPACPRNLALSGICSLVAGSNPLQTTSTAFRPPFTYSYQCSSTVITSYCSINVYMFLILGFWLPLGKLLLFPFTNWLRKCQAQGRYLTLVWLVDMALPSIYKPIDKQQLEERVYLLDKTRFTLRIVSCMTVLVTFGVSFPPLALVICGTIFSVTYFPLYVMGRALDGAQRADAASGNEDRDYLTRYLETLELESHGIPKALIDVVWILIPVACVFHSFLLFDTVGDAIGAGKAISFAVAMVILPCCLAIAMHRLRFAFCDGSSAIEPSASYDCCDGDSAENSPSEPLPRFEPLDDSFDGEEDDDDNGNNRLNGAEMLAVIAPIKLLRSNDNNCNNNLKNSNSSSYGSDQNCGNSRPLSLHALSPREEVAVVAAVHHPTSSVDDIEAGIAMTESQQISSRRQQQGLPPGPRTRRHHQKKGSVFVADLAELRKRNRRSFEGELDLAQQRQRRQSRQPRSIMNSSQLPEQQQQHGSGFGSGGSDGGFMDAITNIRRHAKRYSFLVNNSESSRPSPPQQQKPAIGKSSDQIYHNSKLEPIPSGSASAVSRSLSNDAAMLLPENNRSSPLPVFRPSIIEVDDSNDNDDNINNDSNSRKSPPKLLPVVANNEEDYAGDLKSKPVFIPLPPQHHSKDLPHRLFTGAYVEGSSSKLAIHMDDNNAEGSSQRPSKVGISEGMRAALQSNHVATTAASAVIAPLSTEDQNNHHNNNNNANNPSNAEG